MAKKYDDLKELNTALPHPNSDLRLTNKNLEGEYASLLTALQLTQDDCTGKHTSTVKSNQQKPHWRLQVNRRDEKNSDDIAKNMPTIPINQKLLTSLARIDIIHYTFQSHKMKRMLRQLVRMKLL